MWNRLGTFFKHRWLDESDTRRAIAPDALERLRQRVAASERRHSGEIRIFVEASLPIGYVWRHLRHNVPMSDLVRERALAVFGKLRVWDTEHNNGVLVYLSLAERRVELVADRALDRVVEASCWPSLVQRMGTAFAAGRYEEGLAEAVDGVGAQLMRHFPLQPGAQDSNELPDVPQLS